MKTKKTKEAVSLIVLVLTIVIMIILAGVIIISLNNSGIIDRAKNAVSETNLKNMQELANVAWGEAYLELKGEKTPDAIKTLMLQKLKGKGVTDEELAKYTFEVTTGGVEVAVNTGSGEETPEEGGTETPEPEEPEINAALNPTGTIPEGGTYYRYEGGAPQGPEHNPDYENNPDYYYYGAIGTATAYNSGTNFPTTVENGDVYIYGDYMYVYGAAYGDDIGQNFWYPYPNMTGWGAKYIGTSTTPREILESINGSPLTCLEYTFANSDITTAPTIPNSVKNLSFAFYDCFNLVTPPVIPASVDNMFYTFNGCESLTGTITINANPTYYDSCFSGCDMSNITLTGTSTMLNELEATAEE